MRNNISSESFAVAGGMDAFGPLCSPRVWIVVAYARLRRELRMAFFSVLFGIGIGAAAVITLSGNNTADNARVPHGVGSASVISEDRTEPVLGYNSPQPAGIEPHQQVGGR